MSYSPSQLNPSVARQIASNPLQQLNLLVDTMLEASYAYNLEDTPEVIQAKVISGARSGESTGAGSDWIDARLISVGGELYYEILVKTMAGKGLTSPDPTDPALSPEQVEIAYQSCEWARSSTTVTGTGTPPNSGDIVECFYEKGAAKNSNFNGLRYKSNVLTPQQLDELIQGGGLGGGAQGGFGASVSPLGAAVLSGDEGYQTHSKEIAEELKRAVEANADYYDPKSGGGVPGAGDGGAKWDDVFNLVAIRDISTEASQKDGAKWGKFGDILYMCWNDAYKPYKGINKYEAADKDPGGDKWKVWKYKISTKAGYKFFDRGYGMSKGVGTATYYKGQYNSSHVKRGHRATKNKTELRENPPPPKWRTGYVAFGTAGRNKFSRSTQKGMIQYDADLGWKDIGLNIHKSGKVTNNTKVQPNTSTWSLGCQIFQDSARWKEFMELTQWVIKDGDKDANKHKEWVQSQADADYARWSDRITYTILTHEQVDFAKLKSNEQNAPSTDPEGESGGGGETPTTPEETKPE